MTVYETDQWSSSQVSRQGLTVADIEQSHGEIYGGDADTVRSIFGGGKIRRREVLENASPDIGDVWFRPDDTGKLVFYRANYDSSD
jgi:hypothetical protein